MTVEPITGPGQAGPNILIVDDSAIMRTMIKRVAALAGTPLGTIFEAANGREALTILEQHPVQFVFTDLNMPVRTGTELLREMQSRDHWRGIVRIVVSTDGSDSRRHEVSGLSVAIYVEKDLGIKLTRR